MNAKNSSYDHNSVDILFLEESPLQGRKTDLRLLLKSLNLAKSGQPKAVLISGDEGIGKTALLNAFVETVNRGLYCQILDLRDIPLDSPERIYVAILSQLEEKAQAILEEALVDINQMSQALNLHWSQADLLQAISRVKFQEFSDETGALAHQEELTKSIYQTASLIQKLKPSTKEMVERVVRRVVEPWVLIAAMLVAPTDPQIQKAMQRAKILSTELSEALPIDSREEALPLEGSLAPAEKTTSPTKVLPLLDDFGEIDLDSVAPVQVSSVDEEALDLNAVGDLAVVRTSLGREESQPINKSAGELARLLLHVLHYINKAIRNRDSAILLVMDDWEQILQFPEPQREKVKDFLAMVLRETTEQKSYHLMVCLTSRSEGESYTLGGALYTLFRNKILLSGLSETARRVLLQESLGGNGIEIDESVLQRVYTLTEGNPFWLLKIGHYLQSWAESNDTDRITPEQFRNLGIEKPKDILEVSFSRVKLTFLHQEDQLYKTILGLVTTLKRQVYSVGEALAVLSRPDEVSDGFIIDVLRTLFQHGFLQEVESACTPEGDPRYGIQSRLILEYLNGMTQTLQGDVATHDKINYLKKIIPLSLQSGELDHGKTQEIIALNKAMGHPEMMEFLEETFLAHIQDPKPHVRITALNNISALVSDRTIEAVIQGLQDEEVAVREAAARALCQFCKNRGVEAKYQSEILEALMSSIEDPAESVRAEIFGALSHFSWFQELLPVILKGMSDPYEAVRLSAIRFLIDCGTVSPAIHHQLVQALEDELAEIRRLACVAIQRYPDPETVRLLVRALENDADSTVRIAAIDSLSYMQHEAALVPMAKCLRGDSSEDVRLAAARAFGKWRGAAVEEILLSLLQQPKGEPDAVLWSSVRSLGNIGRTPEALDVLNRLKRSVTNEIVQMTVDVAARKIAQRLEDFQRMDRQLSVASSLPSVDTVVGQAEEVMAP